MYFLQPPFTPKFIHKQSNFFSLGKYKYCSCAAQFRRANCSSELHTASFSRIMSSYFPPYAALFHSFFSYLFVGRIFFLFLLLMPLLSPFLLSSLPPFLLRESNTELELFTLVRLQDLRPGVQNYLMAPIFSFRVHLTIAIICILHQTL